MKNKIFFLWVSKVWKDFSRARIIFFGFSFKSFFFCRWIQFTIDWVRFVDPFGQLSSDVGRVEGCCHFVNIRKVAERSQGSLHFFFRGRKGRKNAPFNENTVRVEYYTTPYDMGWAPHHFTIKWYTEIFHQDYTSFTKKSTPNTQHRLLLKVNKSEIMFWFSFLYHKMLRGSMNYLVELWIQSCEDETTTKIGFQIYSPVLGRFYQRV